MLRLAGFGLVASFGYGLQAFDVTSYGAVSGGTAAVNKAAFIDCQTALDATPKGGVFFIPAGTYDVGDWVGPRLPHDSYRHYIYQGEGRLTTIVKRSVDGTAGSLFIDVVSGVPVSHRVESTYLESLIQHDD